jgi:hypothetical protein
MKSLRVLPALFCLTVCAAFAADEVPQLELRGIVAAGGKPRFALAVPGGAQAWVSVGDNFDGWKLSDYHDDTLVLTKDGHTATVRLSSSIVGVSAGTSGATATTENTKATLADAEEVLNKMKFDEMMGRMMEQQKKAAANMVKQLAAQAGGAGASDDMQAFQAKLMDTMFAELTADSMRSDIARIYSDVYSKEELAAMANFYGTPAGQAMVDKQPEVSQKMTEVLTPRLMAAMPKVQQMAADFAAEQAAKKPAAADPAK